VQRFMLEQGFQLVDLINPVRLPSTVPSGQAYEDTLLFANAIFFRNGESSDAELRIRQALVATLLYYKHGLAESLLQQYDEAKGTQLAEAFSGRSYNPEKQTREELIAENASFRSQLTVRDTDLAAAHAELAELRRILAAAESQISALNEQLDSTRRDSAEQQQKVGALDGELSAARQANSALELRLEAAQEQASDSRSLLADSEAAIARLSEEMGELAAALRRDRQTGSVAEQQLQQVLNSRSFRLLAPARRLRAILLPRK